MIERTSRPAYLCTGVCVLQSGQRRQLAEAQQGVDEGLEFRTSVGDDRQILVEQNGVHLGRLDVFAGLGPGQPVELLEAIRRRSVFLVLADSVDK